MHRGSDRRSRQAGDCASFQAPHREAWLTQFNTSKYRDTKNEIAWRIWTLLKNADLRDAFAAPFNRCHLELDRKPILIDCDIDVLQDYSGLFGRYSGVTIIGTKTYAKETAATLQHERRSFGFVIITFMVAQDQFFVEIYAIVINSGVCHAYT